MVCYPTLNQVAPYQTIQASVDAPIVSERLNNNKFGAGIMFFNDKAGDGALTTNSALASISSPSVGRPIWQVSPLIRASGGLCDEASSYPGPHI
jgi:hypothetical protein